MLNYIIVINMICFILMGFDKYQAIHNNYRIPEVTLITLSFLGGGIGSFLGMKIFHHKTKKLKFQILIPLSILFLIIFIMKY